MEFLYFLIALIATTLGSLTGIGGGVIIKPILDFLGDYPIGTISLLSSATVFTMALVNTYRNRFFVKEIDLKILGLLALFSFIGGIIGKTLFYYSLDILGISSNMMMTIQGITLIIILIIVIILTSEQEKIKVQPVTSNILTLLIGLSLGIISSFLAIGGGPLNVIVLIIFWQLSPKQAAIGSVTIILFSQLSSIIQTLTVTPLRTFDLSVLPPMLIAALLGGYIGSHLIHHFAEEKLKHANIGMLVSIITLNVYNIISLI